MRTTLVLLAATMLLVFTVPVLQASDGGVHGCNISGTEFPCMNGGDACMITVCGASCYYNNSNNVNNCDPDCDYQNTYVKNEKTDFGANSCSDGIDNDCDTKIDINDSDCNAGPDVNVTNAPDSWTNNTITAGISCSDSETKCNTSSYGMAKTDWSTAWSSCSNVNAANWTDTSTLDISAYGAVCARAQDNLSAYGYSNVTQFTVDQQAPNNPSINNCPNTWTNSPTQVNTTCNGDTGGSGCNTSSLRMSSTTSERPSCDSYSNMNKTDKATYDEERWVCAGVKDYAGNINRSGPQHCKIDTTNPGITMDSYPSAPDTTDTITINASATDDISNISTIEIFNGSSTSAPLLKTCTGELECGYEEGQLSDGDHNYTGRATDNAGNTNVTTITVNVDDASCSVDCGSWNTLGCGLNGGGLNCSWDEELENRSCTDPSCTEWRCQQNKTACQDNTAPNVSVFNYPTSWQASCAYDVNVSCADNNSGCDMDSRRIGLATSSTSCPSYSTLDSSGAEPPVTYCTYEYVCGGAKDNAGNVNVTDTPAEVKVDGTEPNITISYEPSSPDTTDEINITVTGDDGQSGLNIINVTFNGTLKNQCASTTCKATGLGPFSQDTYSYGGATIDNVGRVNESYGTITVSSASCPSPTAAFTYNPTEPNVSENINFDASSSTPGSGESITSWEWDWTTDGTYDDTGETTTHSYGSYGEKNVTLRVTNSCGATNTTDTTVDVQPDSCKLDSASILSCSSSPCSTGDSVNMTGQIAGDCSVVDTFQIDMSDSSNTCNVTFTGGDMDGVNDTSPQIGSDTINGTWTVPTIPPACQGASVSADAGAVWNGTPVSGNWLDGSSASGSFTFNGSGCSSPTADFEVTPQPAYTGEEVQFNGSSSVGKNLSYAWDWRNNGTFDITNTDAVENNTYSENASEARLRVTDECGNQDEKIKSITIKNATDCPDDNCTGVQTYTDYPDQCVTCTCSVAANSSTCTQSNSCTDSTCGGTTITCHNNGTGWYWFNKTDVQSYGEICGDGFDNDCDGDVDEADSDCSINFSSNETNVKVGDKVNFNLSATDGALNGSGERVYIWRNGSTSGFTVYNNLNSLDGPISNRLPAELVTTLWQHTTSLGFTLNMNVKGTHVITNRIGNNTNSDNTTVKVGLAANETGGFCNDNTDNDGDGVKDCNDPTFCADYKNACDNSTQWCNRTTDANHTSCNLNSDTECKTETACGDGIDNDCDNYMDEEDDDCGLFLEMTPQPTVPPAGEVTAMTSSSDLAFNTNGTDFNVTNSTGNTVATLTDQDESSEANDTFTAPNQQGNYTYTGTVGQHNLEENITVTNQSMVCDVPMKGNVTDESGSDLEMVKVETFYPDENKYGESYPSDEVTYTDVNGEYSFDVKPGEYYVRYSKDGYFAEEYQVDAECGDTITHDETLQDGDCNEDCVNWEGRCNEDCAGRTFTNSTGGTETCTFYDERAKERVDGRTQGSWVTYNETENYTTYVTACEGAPFNVSQFNSTVTGSVEDLYKATRTLRDSRTGQPYTLVLNVWNER